LERELVFWFRHKIITVTMSRLFVVVLVFLNVVPSANGLGHVVARRDEDSDSSNSDGAGSNLFLRGRVEGRQTQLLTTPYQVQLFLALKYLNNEIAQTLEAVVADPNSLPYINGSEAATLCEAINFQVR
jgi:hypothetical protein